VDAWRFAGEIYASDDVVRGQAAKRRKLTLQRNHDRWKRALNRQIGW
jgi:hypothetical protein